MPKNTKNQSHKNKRQQILDVAARLFREKGYKTTSMRDIAKNLNVEAATLYSHIKSKDDILEELVFFIAEKFESGMKDIDESSYSPYQKVKELIALQIRITVENPYAIFLQTQALWHLKDPKRSEYQFIRDKYAQDFLRIIKAGIKQGEIKKVNPEIMLNTILSASRWLYTWYNEDKEISPVELKIQILELLENGFNNPQA